MTPLWLIPALLVGALLTLGDLAQAAALPQTPQLPVLNWVQRSDWVNVTDATTFPKARPAAKPPAAGAEPPPAIEPVGAKGDGVADDTAAIQLVLDRLQTGQTLYFPAGVYRITNTLHIDPALGRGALGITLIGHGRDTVIAWDGAPGGTMFSQHTGWAISRYVGLTWDGRHQAATGFLHRAMKQFETEVRHDYEAFLNFTGDGIHLGGGALATAEIAFTNCLFQHCGTGLFINGGDKREDNGRVNYNYLDNTVRGCDFFDCTQGIYAGVGTNVYVRESHFERIAGVVITTRGEAGNSVRHCSAKDIGTFIDNGSSVGPLTVQDCFVENWRTARDPQRTDGVITLRNGSAPSLIFDNTFKTADTATPAAGLTPILSVNPSTVKYFLAHNLLAVGQKPPQVLSLCAPSRATDAQLGHLVPVEAGSGVVTSSGQRFFRTTVPLSRKIFDAKVEFGAKGDGKTDDTLAVQRTIEAARAYGNDALAYLPQGRYNVSATLQMTGRNYRVGGCGFGTGIIWKGPAGGTTLAITDPDNLTLEHLVIGRHDYPQGTNARDIVQTSTRTAKPGRMTYEQVAVYGMYQAQPSVRGLQLLNLHHGDVVCVDQVNGNILVTDSADATVYLGLSYEGTVTVEGKSLARRGFVGGNVRLGTISNPGIWIKDNHSFVISDLYCESSKQYMRLEGDSTLPAGIVVASGPKFEIQPAAALTTPSVQITNYRGDLLIGPYNYYVMNKQHWFKQEGDAPCSLVLWAGSFYNSAPKIERTTAVYQAIGLRRMGDPPTPEDMVLFQDAGDPAEVLAKVALAVKQLRRLGQVACEINAAAR